MHLSLFFLVLAIANGVAANQSTLIKTKNYSKAVGPRLFGPARFRLKEHYPQQIDGSNSWI